MPVALDTPCARNRRRYPGRARPDARSPFHRRQRALFERPEARSHSAINQPRAHRGLGLGPSLSALLVELTRHGCRPTAEKNSPAGLSVCPCANAAGPFRMTLLSLKIPDAGSAAPEVRKKSLRCVLSGPLCWWSDAHRRHPAGVCSAINKGPPPMCHPAAKRPRRSQAAPRTSRQRQSSAMSVR